jgi:hypothetical protein
MKKIIDVNKIDWLAVAVHEIGGVRATAKLVGRSDATVRRWLKDGLLDTRLKDIVVMADASQVLLEHLARRVGPSAQPQLT